MLFSAGIMERGNEYASLGIYPDLASMRIVQVSSYYRKPKQALKVVSKDVNLKFEESLSSSFVRPFKVVRRWSSNLDLALNAKSAISSQT